VRRPAFAAASAIVALGAVAVAVIFFATQPGPESPAAAPPPEPPRPDSAAAAAALVPDPVQPVPAAPLPEPGGPPRGNTSPTAGRSEVRVLAQPILAVSAALGPMVTPCIPEDLRGHGRGRRGGPRAGADGGPAALIVELAAGEGDLRVVEADVASFGKLSSQHLDCARRALRGQRLRTPTGLRFEPGQRVRMRYVLP